MLIAYFDATQTQKGRRYVAVAGCVARLTKWNAFDQEWAKLLLDEKLPAFHMTDFEAYERNYRGWTRERHEKCWTRARNIIVKHVDFAVGRGVAYDDWVRAQSKNHILQPWDAFTYCANQCLHSVAIWANRNQYPGPIVYIFESGDGHNGELFKLRDDIEQNPTRKMRLKWDSLHILPKTKTNSVYPLSPLQSADVFAFEARKEWENKYTLSQADRIRPLRYSINSLLQGTGIAHDFGFSTRTSLDDLQPYWLQEPE